MSKDAHAFVPPNNKQQTALYYMREVNYSEMFDARWPCSGQNCDTARVPPAPLQRLRIEQDGRAQDNYNSSGPIHSIV